MQTPQFQSSQTIKRVIVCLIALALVVLFFYKWWGSLKEGNLELPALVEALVIILITTFLFLIRLTIQVLDDKLIYQFFPFHFKVHVINRSAIRRAEFEKINPLLWGIGLRYNVITKTAGYILSGNQGIKLELMNGEKLVLSTDEPEKLLIALEK